MIIGGRRAFSLLILGDVLALAVSLYLTLWLRYSEIPQGEALAPYLLPFTFLIAFWILVFYSAGLYSKRLALFPNQLPDALLRTQIANILFAALFFFFIPAFGITPKVILALYFVVSLAAIFLWRLVLYPRYSLRRPRERAVLLAEGAEADELFNEVNGNLRYGIQFSSRKLEATSATLFVIGKGIADPATITALANEGKHIVVFDDMYEEVFDRIPLSQLGVEWFQENAAKVDPFGFIIAKRIIDIVGGLLMGIITLVIAPCIWIGNRIEGSAGPLFITQERMGRRGARIMVYKFRSMQKNVAASGEWTHEGENRVTRVGDFLRRTSLDEFPQFINVLKGEISLIGPRSDIRGLGERLAEALPYYDARYMVTPGITGWAQINQQYEQGNVSPQSIRETRVRLAYDFYYLKHRSLGLDIIIALKTVKRMFFRVSSW